MLTALYRLTVLGLLTHCISALTDMNRELHVLRVLVEHPPYRIPAFRDIPIRKADTSDLEEVFRQHAEDLKCGDDQRAPWPSDTASPEITTDLSAEPASTGEPGRWTPTSGLPTEGSSTPGFPNGPVSLSKTLSPMPATEPENGSPGPAPAFLASGPSHNHPVQEMCRRSECPAYWIAKKVRIQLQGYEAICDLSLGGGQDCDTHNHLPGERQR